MVFTFKELGIPSGNKKINNVEIPVWILQRPTYCRACIRGLVDTDGSIYPKTKKHRYPSIWLSSAIPALRATIDIALEEVGISHSKWTNRPVPQMCIGDSKMVRNYHKTIRFNNPKHIERYTQFAPVV
ncbi:LAGLIDADG family homing endonuclease [Candidatus Undinarchaeota archaeon]